MTDQGPFCWNIRCLLAVQNMFVSFTSGFTFLPMGSCKYWHCVHAVSEVLAPCAAHWVGGMQPELMVPGQLLCCRRLSSFQTKLAYRFVQRLLMGQRWAELYPSTFLSSFGASLSPALSFLFGLVSPSVSPEMNLFPPPLPSLSAWHFAERTGAVLVWIGASCRTHPEEMLWSDFPASPFVS